jgi:hypothetical protein
MRNLLVRFTGLNRQSLCSLVSLGVEPPCSRVSTALSTLFSNFLLPTPVRSKEPCAVSAVHLVQGGAKGANNQPDPDLRFPAPNSAVSLGLFLMDGFSLTLKSECFFLVICCLDSF